MAKRKKTRPKSADETRASSLPSGPTVHRPFRGLGSPGAGRARTAAAKRAEAVPEAPAPEPDEGSFAEHMRDVKAFDDGPRRLPRTVSELESPERKSPSGDPDAGARAELSRLVTDGIRFDVMDDGTVLEGRRLDVDPREIRRLRRGAYAVDGKLDLHGQSVEEARSAVTRFVRARRIQGDRAVLLVHGRGSHSPGGHAVLRGELAAWLSQGSAARDVAAFASVPSGWGRSGGPSGAVFVLLSR